MSIFTFLVVFSSFILFFFCCFVNKANDRYCNKHKREWRRLFLYFCVSKFKEFFISAYLFVLSDLFFYSFVPSFPIVYRMGVQKSGNFTKLIKFNERSFRYGRKFLKKKILKFFKNYEKFPENWKIPKKN